MISLRALLVHVVFVVMTLVFKEVKVLQIEEPRDSEKLTTTLC